MGFRVQDLSSLKGYIGSRVAVHGGKYRSAHHSSEFQCTPHCLRSTFKVLDG